MAAEFEVPDIPPALGQIRAQGSGGGVPRVPVLGEAVDQHDGRLARPIRVTRAHGPQWHVPGELDDLPLDFLLLEYEVEPSELTVARLMKLQTAVSRVGKHILLKTEGIPSLSELELLRDLPVDAIVLDVDTDDYSVISAAREAIDALEPRKPRGHRDDTPHIPQAGVPEAVDHVHEDEEWDDDLDELKVRN